MPLVVPPIRFWEADSFGLGPQLSASGGSSQANQSLVNTNLELGAAFVFGTVMFQSGSSHVNPGMEDRTNSNVALRDYSLTSSSSMIDYMAALAFVPDPGALDIDGDVRLRGAGIDPGADEFVDCNVLTNYGPVTPNGSGHGPGGNQPDGRPERRVLPVIHCLRWPRPATPN